MMNSYPDIMQRQLTQSQLLLWTGQELNPESPLYNMVLTFEIKGAIDPDRFAKAFNQLVQQCDAMRTVFITFDGTPVQKVQNQWEADLTLIDLTGRPGSVQAWIKEQSQRVFDLSQRCYESALLRLAEDHFVWYLNQHHLITDAWGVSVQYKALMRNYISLQSGDGLLLPELPKFSDYLSFEQTSEQLPQYGRAKSYWEQKTQISPPAPRLYGHSDQVLNTGSVRVSLDLGMDRSKRLRALTNEAELRAWTDHLSLFNIFATLLFSYLYRVSGQKRLSVGTPAHHRPSNVFKETPGVFIELYPLYMEVDETESFSALHSRVSDEVNMYLRNSVPGTTSAKLNRTFHAVLNYIHATFEDFDGMPMQSEWVHPGHSDPRHQIRLQVHDFDATGNMELHFDFNTQVFNYALQELAPYHFLKLLDAFLEDRDQPIGKPTMVDHREYGTISSGLTTAFSPETQFNSVLNLFDRQVKLSPNQIALISGQQKMTYQSLDHKSNQLAWYLNERDIGKGQRVVLHLTRSFELLIGVLGVLKSGAAYVPLDSNYPDKRIAYVLEDLNASLVLTDDKLETDYPGVSHLKLDSDWDQIRQYPESKTPESLAPDSLAYISYTSGTSGIPKGVMIPHAALSNYIQWAENTYASNQRLCFPLFTTPAFDLTVTSILLPLTTGGKLVIYPEAEGVPDLALTQVINDNLVDAIKLTPSHLGLLNKHALKNTRVRKIIVGGEDFKSDQAKEVLMLFGGKVEIYNEYGPTEATVGCIAHRVELQDLKPASVPIGKPIYNTQIYLLDSYLNPVPQGVTGEIYLAGKGLAAGYWNQPIQTDERFIRCPIDPGNLMYRTGDLGRLNQQFNLEYQGRRDRQVKVGGIRVELGEIEAVLTQHPALKQAAVVLHQRSSEIPTDLTYCGKCGLPSNYPSIEFDEAGICDICNSFNDYQSHVRQYFKNEQDLKSAIDQAAAKKQGKYHCLMLLSGGKDSTYALARLVDMGYHVLAFTLDNGYISEQAMANIKRVVSALGVDHVFGSTEAMNAIFVDSLNRHSNVCNGCFKTIYTLSTSLAVKKGIPLIVTGLSRGQLFETRLAEELFRDKNVDSDQIDQTILQARKAYHRTEDAVNRLLDVSVFQDESVFERVQYIDFYRYCEVELDQMLAYLDQHLPWVRPSDTGRSTNCLINQVGIYVHRKHKGYSNYAFPYSWDVRIGHKVREDSLEEVNEEVDEQQVFRIMEEIGYSSGENQQLTAYYVGPRLTRMELRQFMSKHLPDYMIPTHFQNLQEMPLTPNAKIDYQSLPGLFDEQNELSVSHKPPTSQVEQMLCDFWSEVLQIQTVGIEDNFLHLGGNSLTAIRLISRINEAFHLELSLNTIFEYPTIATFGKLIDDTIAKLLGQES